VETTASMAMLSGAIVSIVAWLRIRLSRGRLQHAALCFVGLVGSIVAGTVVESSTTGTYAVRQQLLHEQNPGVHPAYGNLRSKPKPPDRPVVLDGVDVPYGFDPEDYVYGPRVRAMLQRLQAMYPGDVTKLSSFYNDRDFEVMTSMQEAERTERGNKGLLGLPLASREFLGGTDLGGYGVFTITFTGDRGSITLRDLEGDQRRGVIAYVEKLPNSGTPSEWVFSLAPVVKCELAVAARPTSRWPETVDPATPK
jgi:hypothetical protein